MNAEQYIAYEWAKNQNYPSVAARYAKLLAETIDQLQAECDRINDFEHSQCAKLLVENGQIRNAITQMDPTFFSQKCRVCGCNWNHACNDNDYWVEDDLCSACAEQGLGGQP